MPPLILVKGFESDGITLMSCTDPAFDAAAHSSVGCPMPCPQSRSIPPSRRDPLAGADFATLKDGGGHGVRILGLGKRDSGSPWSETIGGSRYRTARFGLFSGRILRSKPTGFEA
jgi:hypothetical protein